MRRFLRAKSGFVRMPDDKLLVLAHTVFTSVKDNSFFINPIPNLLEFEEILSNFKMKLARARYIRSPFDTAIKNEARRELEIVLKEVAFYVNKKAKGSLVILLSSGFEISHYRKRTNPPEKVVGLQLKDGRKAGQMVLSFRSQSNVRLYEYRCSTEIDKTGEVSWVDESHITTSSKNNLIAPVIPGQVYFLSVRAINTRGISDWCDPVTWMAR